MEEKVLEFLKKYKIVGSEKSFVIGFSGGQDSLCLIDILHKLSKAYNFKIIAAHLNHNWRGESSKKEQCSCMEYCKERDIEFQTKTLDTTVKKTEETARAERYKFFEEIVKKTGAAGVFTAHTKTDNTETILYRIIKGTGVFGLCAIPEIREEKGYTIFRPMLDATREETGVYCCERGLLPAKDESNEDLKYARNNLRLNIIPQLKKINPNLDDAIENLSKVAKDYEWIVSVSNASKPLTPDSFRIFSAAEKKVSVHKFLIQNELEYDAKKIEQIVEFLDENITKPCGETLSLTTGKWLFASKTEIKIIDKIKASKIEEIATIKTNQDSTTNFQEKTLIFKVFSGEAPRSFPTENELKSFVKIPECISELELRTRRDGDIIQPFGGCGTIKLKKFFINKGIAEHKRDEILLLARENEIYWAIGVGLSEKLRVTEKPTHTIELR